MAEAKGMWRWGVAGLVGLVAILAVAITTADGPVAPEAAAEVTIQGPGLPPLSNPASDAAVGMRAPSVNGADFEGTPVELVPGSVRTVVVFVAHWCPHCQAEVPRIQALVDSGSIDPSSIVTVATANDATLPNYPPSKWLEREGWTPPVIVDDDTGSTAVAYGVTGFPFFVVLDEAGNVEGRVSGELGTEHLLILFNG